MTKNTWKKMVVAIVVHQSLPVGPSHELRDYLLKRSPKKLLFITHPLLYFKEGYRKSSGYVVFENGKKSKQHIAAHWRLPEPLLYIKDFFYTVLWGLQMKESIDIFFGVDPLNALAGIILKRLRKVKTVVYYNIDYTPARFKNRLLNSVYHFIDRTCCYGVDYNWVGTQRTVQARKENNVDLNKCAKTVIVPDGNHSLSVIKRDLKEIKTHTLVYLGHIDKKQGLDLVLDTLPILAEKIHDIRFIIIGKGDYADAVKEKIKKMKLNNVEYKGYIEDDREVENILTRCGIGVAPYVQDKTSFTYYSEAGKPKYYLGCGIPVIITKVPAIAATIHSRKAGVAIDYDKKEFIDAVLKMTKDKNMYASYKKNAIQMGNEFDWSQILYKASQETLTYIKNKD